MKTKRKKLWYAISILCFSACFFIMQKTHPVFAATKLRTLFAAENLTAGAETESSHPFTVGYKGDVFYEIGMTSPAAFNMRITDSSKKETASEKISADPANWQKGKDGLFYYTNRSALSVKTGKYRIRLTFAEDTAYSLAVVQESFMPSLNVSEAKLTIGFTTRLKVSNAGAYAVKWMSGNKKIAAVNSKGIVTGKKKGSCKITATINGEKFSCTVKVYPNTYNDKKLENNRFQTGKVSIYVYHVAFDAKDNMKVKIRVINNDSSDIARLANVKFYVKAQNKRIIAKYNLGTKKFTVKKGTYRDFAITIPKSQIYKTKKPIDLRNLSSVEIQGSYYVKG